MTALISLLPDELRISILHDWIGTPLTLCALDIALCNRLLRQNYLSWLERFGLTIISNISFVNDDKNLTNEEIDMIFFDWCKKRKVFPSSFSYSCKLIANGLGKIPKQVLDVMKHVARLKAYYKALDCGNHDGNTELVSNILNDCPQLKHLIVSVGNHTNNFLSFECSKRSYRLISLELHEIKFCYAEESFYSFVRACPMLEDIKIWNCGGIELNRVKYLLRQCKHLASLFVCFVDFNVIDVADVSDHDNDVNMCMKSLTLKNLSAVTVTQRSKKLLSVLRTCPALENLVLSGDDWDEVMEVEETVHWCDMINHWHLLKSLALEDCEWMVSNRFIMFSIGSSCGISLNKLSIHQCVSNGLVALICEAFTALKELELRGSTDVTYDTLVQYFFPQANFAQSLQTLTLFCVFVSESVVDYSTLLSVFPALQKLQLTVFTSHVQIISPFPAMQQIKELELFTPLGMFLGSLDDRVMLNGFVNMQSLSLSRFVLTKKLMQSILTLPQLEILALRDVLSDDSDPDVFHMEQYAIYCALKEFKNTKVFRFSVSMLFTEKILRSILTCFASSLERLDVQNVDIDEVSLYALQQEYRFKTSITCERLLS